MNEAESHPFYGSLSEQAVLEAPGGVWRLHQHSTVPYPNDSFAENELGRILSEASDLSSLSPELSNLGLTWPASYYLSPRRTNLLRGFDFSQVDTVVEVGAGCGTITRLLGEKCSHVLAIEGEAKRAQNARLRTRDLSSVEVLNAPIGAVDLPGIFDAVVCVGVLEYESLFAHLGEGNGGLLGSMKQMITEGGSLILAIENQLGLKYFSGSAEDHSGIAYDGIEGYQRSNGEIAKTYSRSTLRTKLQDAGFSSIEFFYPFPDYKLVDSVLSEAAMRSPSPSLAEFAYRGQASDYTNSGKKSQFDQRAVFSELLMDGLGSEFANSFLVIARNAGQGQAGSVGRDWDAISFSTGERKSEYWTQSTIESIGSESPLLRKVRLGEGEQAQPDSRVKLGLPQDAVWNDELTIAGHIRGRSKAGNYSLERFAQDLSPWVQRLRPSVNGDGNLPGSFVDAIPQNYLLTESGVVPIDLEMRWNAELPLTFVVARGVLEVIRECEDTPGSLRALGGMSRYRVLAEVASENGVAIDRRALLNWAKLEAEMQNELRVSSISRTGLLRWASGRIRSEQSPLAVRAARKLGRTLRR